MDLDQLRRTMAATCRVGIRRRRTTSLLWLVGLIAFASTSAITLVDGAQTGSGASVAMGGACLVAVVAGLAWLLPGLLGRPRLVVDAEGLRVGRQLAVWSRIATVERVETPGVRTYGVRQVLVRVQDEQGRAVLRSPWPWIPRHTLPRGIEVRPEDLVVFLREQLAARRGA